MDIAVEGMCLTIRTLTCSKKENESSEA